jgi:hypothetical protein
MAGKKRVHTTAVELDVDDRRLEGKLRRDERLVAKSARNMRRELSRVDSPVTRAAGGARARGDRTRRLGGAMGGVGGTLKGAAAFGGVYGIANEIKRAKQFEEILVDTAVRGGQSRAWMDKLRGSMIDLSNEYGISKEQLADYVGVIIDQTGNTKLATATLRDMTAVAYSANVPMGELAGTVVEMQSKLGLAPTEFVEALGVLASQADKGKVPLNQMSKFLPEVLNAAGAFGHRGIGALRDYGAVLQMAARGAGSLAEANTAMNRGLDQIIAKRTAIERSLGIKLKKNGAWLQLGDMLKLISSRLVELERSGGKVTKIMRGGKEKKVDVENWVLDIFGIRGKKMMLPMLQQARAGFGKRVGADPTGAGGLTSFNALQQAGGAATIADRVARKRKLSPELDKWNKSVERLKNKLHVHLLPAITKLGDILPQISTALEWMIDNWKLLLAIWGSAKMLRFLNGLRGLGGGGGRILGGAGRLLGMGGAAAGTSGGGAAATGIAGTVGGGGLIGGLGTAAVALGAFTASLAPAVAGLKAMGDAYDPQKQKELRKKLTKQVRSETGAVDWVQKILGVDTGFQSLEDIKGETWEQRRERLAREKWRLLPSESSKMMGAFKTMRAGKYGEANFQLRQLDPWGEKTQKLASASDFELQAMGLNRDVLTELVNLTKMSSSRLDAAEARFKQFEAFAKKTGKLKVVLVDPNKTPAGATKSRAGSK